MSGCSVFKKWFGTSAPEFRAFYVEKKDYDRLPTRRLMINASASEAIQLITTVLRNQFDTTSSVIRLEATNTFSSTQESQGLFRVETPVIEESDPARFKEYFHMGEYILDRKGVEVRADEYVYSIDAVVSISGRMLKVEFTANPYVEWNLYVDTDTDRPKKVPEANERFYGIGSYRYEKTVMQYGRNGRPYESEEWVENEVDDLPKSKGVLEQALINKMLEQAAISGIQAFIDER